MILTDEVKRWKKMVLGISEQRFTSLLNQIKIEWIPSSFLDDKMAKTAQCVKARNKAKKLQYRQLEL